MSATVLTCIFLACYYGITLWLLRGVKIKTRELCLCSIMLALTLVLDSIRIPLPTGATMPLLSLVPLMLLALVCDTRLVFITGWACGLLAMLVVPAWQPVHPAQILVEHLVCFSAMGYVGVFGTRTRRQILGGMLLASLFNISGHILSGAIFFGQFAWEGWGPWGYSLVYNITQNVPLCILCGGVVLAFPQMAIKRVKGALRT